MKYIRTKEHIYKRLFIDRAIINECGYGTCDEELNPIGETIIKQADTIEELCDEFVGIDSQGHYIIHNDEWLEGARIIPLEEITYHAAIWTEWGLKYVAKMNEKGELKLL